jgi:alpha,alpha-trehalose phosphorylase
VTYRGQMLEIEVGGERVEYTLREGESVTFHHEMEEVRLTREHPSAIRPVSRRLLQ